MRHMTQYDEQDANSLQVVYYNISCLVCNHNFSFWSTRFHAVIPLRYHFFLLISANAMVVRIPSSYHLHFECFPFPCHSPNPPLISCCDRGGPVPPLCRTNTHLVGKYKDLVPPESGRDQERHRASPALGSLHANPANIAQCLSSAIHPAVSPYRPR